MGLRRGIRRLWGGIRTIRWLAYVLGGLLGAGGVGAGLAATARAHARSLMETDDPEGAAAKGVWHGAHASLPPHTVLVALGVLLVLLLGLWALSRLPMRRPDNPFDRDPRRLFGQADRKWIGEAAGGRCEHRHCLGLLRCRRPIEQLDHWYPYAKGGATSRRNLVGLCARCNRRKSDRVPTLLQTRQLARARRRYFPASLHAYDRPDGRDA